MTDLEDDGPQDGLGEREAEILGLVALNPVLHIVAPISKADLEAWGRREPCGGQPLASGDRKDSPGSLSSVMHSAPLWLRWVLVVLVLGGASVALVVAIKRPDGSPRTDAASLLSTNAAGRVEVRRDQAPRFAPLPPGATPRAALQWAITRDVSARVHRREIQGPAGTARCVAASARRGDGRHAFRCTAPAGGFGYPFFAVADTQRRLLAWCKFDPGPAAQVGASVSSRCR